MKTGIYISRKLEKLIPKKFIRESVQVIENPLGTWSANIFYVSRKKCWILTNSVSFYTVILQDISTAAIKNINEIFTHTLFHQLQTDEIAIDIQEVQNLFGEVDLFTTNNDRRTIGVQNSLSINFDDWKYEFGDFSNWPFRDLNRRINGIPYKQIGWKKPKEKMKEILGK
ncbi:MAG: hypothetical protein JEY96_03260 [Bacteroidales bacterium]|nr:hypothetical protein [Bacteroidales bacterium]